MSLGICTLFLTLLNGEVAKEASVKEESLTYGDAIILGIVEGLTEYLPVSSTGHLILMKDMVSTGSSEDGEAALDAYLVVIQIGAILAVVLMYASRIRQVIMGFLGKDVVGLRIGLNLIIAFIPAAVIGLAFESVIKKHLFGTFPVIVALIVGGFVMLIVERIRKGRDKNISVERSIAGMTMPQALLIGFFQCFALIPGTSRSMVVIVGGYVVRLSPVEAAEFSFLLGLITLSAAAGYEMVFGWEELTTYIAIGPMLVGLLIAGAAAAASVKFLVSFLSRYGLSLFGWYRILLGGFLLMIQ